MSEEDLSDRALGDFQVVRRIGSGAMGVVYEAVERSLRRVVAIKVLPDDVTRDGDRRRRFMREARAAAAVHHPCVATIFQVGTATVDGREVDFIAMELVRGGSLRDRLAAGPLPVDEAVRIAIDIARGLARAHEVGVVHRDIKPDNVMLTAGGDVKILDFGVARFDAPAPLDPTQSGADVQTGAGRMFGSPGYMSPEQARGGPIDGRSDLFSLGVLLYELLTGTRPFDAANALELILASIRDAHVDVRTLRADVPPRISAVIDRCLAKEPVDRYVSAAALVADLRGESAPAIATPAPEGFDPLALETLRGVATPQPTPLAAPSATITGTPRSIVPPTPARRRRVLMGIALLAGAAGVVFAVSLGGDSTPPSPPPGIAVADVSTAAELHTDAATRPADAAPGPMPPGLEAGGVLACPILEVAGSEEPSGWLGAAAAQLACERATLLMGGLRSRTLVPAQLLDLPNEPIDEFPWDPFGDAGARDKTLAAATTRASAWIDGKVTQTPDEFTVELSVVRGTVRTPPARAKGRALYQAVRDAMTALVAAGELPTVDKLAPEVARWEGFEDVDLALVLFDFDAGFTTGVGTRAAFEALAAERDRLGLRWPLIARQAWIDSPDADPPPPPPPPDRSSPTARMRSALITTFAEPGADRLALADELAALRAQTEDSPGRIALTNAEAVICHSAGDDERARQLELKLVATEPRAIDWVVLSDAAMMTPSYCPIARAQAAWHPREANSWHMLSYCAQDAATTDLVLRRAIVLAPAFPVWSTPYAMSLVMSGKPVRARSIAARLSEGGPVQVAASDAILALADASEARFAASFARSYKALMAQESIGRIMTAERDLLVAAFSVGVVLGRGAEVADAFAERFVLGETNRIVPSHFALMLIAEHCAFASRPVAERCFERLRSLDRAGFFVQGGGQAAEAFLVTAERFSQGDYAAVVAAGRPLLQSRYAPSYLGVAFERVGDYATANQLYEGWMKRAALLGGASVTHVRAAQLACKLADYARCRALAQTVIDKWSVADAKVPWVDDMRALIATIPP